MFDLKGGALIAAVFVGLFVVLLLSRMVRTEAFQDAGMGGAKARESTAKAVETFELSRQNAEATPYVSTAKAVETFDNTGALMNLASTRVLTAGEVRAERKAEARQVAHDLADMTE